jgi:ATP-dependent Clp protease protease subunit
MVERIDNQITFHDDVSDDSCSKLAKSLQEAKNEAILARLKYDVEIPIKLNISSYGGSIMAGLTVVDMIESSSVPVHTYVKGYAASMGTILSVVGKKRFIDKNSYMLIHELSSGMWGKLSDMKDEMQNLDILMSTLTNIYLKHTKIPKKTLQEMLKKDLWFNAKKCLKLGLVDEIIG